MGKNSKLPPGFGQHDYGPKGIGQQVLFWVGVIVCFVVIGAGMREDNVLLIAIGVVLALLFARQVKEWYTPRS
jgi:hypothetical protein